MFKCCHFLFLFSILGLSGIVSAKEISSGSIEIYGDLDFSYSSLKLKPEGSSDVDADKQKISTAVLYYPLNNFGIGLTWEYESSESESNSSKSENSANVIGPGITYNISLSDKLSIKLIAAIAKATAESTSGGSTTKLDGMAWQGGAGLAYFLTESASLNAGVSYLSYSQEVDSTKQSFDTAGFNVGIGVSIYIE